MRGQKTHLDTNVLAEFRAGLITGRSGARIAAHLVGCDQCTALDGKLAGVSALLAAVPAPTMPDSVARRLDTVLAAEVANKNLPERARVDSSPDRATHERRAGNRGFRLLALRVLAPAAAVLLAAGGYGLSRLGGPGTQATASSAGQAASSAGHAAAQGAAPADSQPRAKPEIMSPRGFAVITSGTNYLSGTLRQQLAPELPSPAPAHPAMAPSGRMVACVHLVTGGVKPVFVDRARFEGRPATIIVAHTGQGYTAWVVGPDCSATSRDVLVKTTLPPGI